MREGIKPEDFNPNLTRFKEEAIPHLNELFGEDTSMLVTPYDTRYKYRPTPYPENYMYGIEDVVFREELENLGSTITYPVSILQLKFLRTHHNFDDVLQEVERLCERHHARFPKPATGIYYTEEVTDTNIDKVEGKVFFLHFNLIF